MQHLGSIALVAIGFLLGLLYGMSLSGPASVPVRTRAVADGRRARYMLVEDEDERRRPPVSAEASMTGDGKALRGASPFVLLGVISSPASFGRRAMLRKFAIQAAGPSNRTVRAEYVFGDQFYERPPSVSVQERLAQEVAEYDDAVFVEARERLPHVGKATEKSAAWWLTAPKRSAARFFCKTDDDSLIHHAHLASALEVAEREAARQGSPHVLFSYIRWRGWLPFNRFQACGGGWGGPIDAIRHMLDPKEHCELAEGPFPQGTGQLTCMSRGLALELANHADFGHFLRVAMVRNDFGQKCTSANECAAHAQSTHMWHHEDAGISYNVWRVANERQLKISVVHMPERGWIWPWFAPKIAEPGQSARAIMMHKVTPETLPEVLRHWRVAEPAPAGLAVDCSQTCTSWGWKWARRPCGVEPPLVSSKGWRGFRPPWNGSLCHLKPVEVGWKCCFLKVN